VDTVLRPLTRIPQTTTPLDGSFAQMARLIGAALGEAPAVSQRTELFRPLPADAHAWLLTTFPTYFQNARGEAVAMAPHHEEFWRWLWGLRPGVAQPPFISIWSRGGGKSTSIEVGSAIVGYFGLRRYALYVCSTQKQSDDHVANVATLLEALGVERAVNRYGFSRGWNINRLRTAEGFTMDAIGLDAAARGVRIDFSRPDLLLLDELDEQLDSPPTIEKKIEVLTRSILPTGDAALSVVGVQNIPNVDGVFAQLADGRAEFLMGRYVSGPHPALVDLPEQDWYVLVTDPLTGTHRFAIPDGRPVWAGQDRAACEKLLNDIGPRAFEIECLHRIGRLSGKVFRREWFEVVDDWPRRASLVRYWDFAATAEPTGPHRGKDPDWTVGLLLALWQGQFWVVDMQRVRLSSYGVEGLVQQTARLDGRHVEVWLEEEGGASGKAVSSHYRQHVLLGYTVRTWHSTGSKGDRARSVSAAAEARNVFLVRGHWNSQFLDEVPRFGLPGAHDDIVDALSGAHYALTLGQTLLPSDFSLAKALEGQTQAGVEARAQAAAVIPGMAALWGLGDDAFGETVLLRS
jgi:predicted phage terminase large subunit-like protein